MDGLWIRERYLSWCVGRYAVPDISQNEKDDEDQDHPDAKQV